MPHAARHPSRPGLATHFRLALPALALLASSAFAQQASYPTPLLKAVSPPGAKAGTAVEVMLAGGDLDDATALHFSSPKVTAERLPDPKPDPKKKKDKNAPPPPPRFKVTVAKDATAGIHDVRVVGKWGISNPRAFVVGELPEVREKEPNSDVEQANRVEVGTVANGAIADRTDVDYFTFAGKKGQRVVAHCAASSIDSRLTAELRLFTAAGRELCGNKFYRERDAVVGCTLPEDGDYLVRLCEFAYQGGGPESFYRLTISDRPWIDAAYPPVVVPGKPTQVTLTGRNLPGGKPAEGFPDREAVTVTVNPPAQPTAFPGRLLPRAGTIDGFEYRLDGSNPVRLALADGPVVLDNGANDALEQSQPVPLPCDICGRFERRGDRDHYSFAAKKGDVVVIEGFADRLRSPTDLYLMLRERTKGQLIGEYDAHPDLPDRVDSFFTYSDDPLAKVTIPADGDYDLMVGSRAGSARTSPRDVYWVSLRRARPDFRLTVVGNHESGAGFTLRRGGSQAVQVVCYRQDDFDGEITLAAEGLPAGVTCEPQVLGPRLQGGALVLTASAGAKDWAGEFTITGTATVGGKKVARAAQAGCLVFPAQQNQVGVSRLARALCLAVRDPGPFRLTPQAKSVAIPVGGAATVKLKVEKQSADYKDPVAVDLLAGPAQQNGRTIQFGKTNVNPGQEGSLRIQVPNNAPAGTYTLVFRGNGKYSIDDKAAKKKRNAQLVAASQPVTVDVYSSACELSFGPPVAVRPGSEAAVPVAVKRLHGYAGPVTLEVKVESGGSGISVANVTVPAGANSAKLVLKAAANAKPAKDLTFTVRASAKVDNVTLREEAKFVASVSAQAPPSGGDAGKPAPGPAGKSKVVALVAGGSGGWRYAAGVKGDAWLAPDFADKGWREVKAPFGNGEPEIARRKGTEVPEKGQPLFARRAFEVPAELLKQKGVTFRLRVASDNSAVVYLNGKPADRDSGDHEFSYWNRDVAVPAALLKAGRNVLAIRVDNSAGSSDAYLDAELVAELPQGKK
jgi:hypothetical protein